MRRLAGLAAAAGLTLVSHAAAIDFATSGRASVLFAAPDTTAEKLGVISTAYPLEILLRVEKWAKVRTADGQLAWIELAALNGKPRLMAAATTVPVRDRPAEGAITRFRIQQGVLLEPLAEPDGGWIKVKHAEGGEGYARIRDLWGI